jgi:RNA polymerase primary sigma factor
MMSDSLTLFLNQAGRIPLLTADEEILLGRRIQAMINLLQDNPSGPYSRDEQFTIKRGKRAKDRMVAANIRLVASAARKYRGKNTKNKLQLDHEDLLQEGILGLIRAAEKFDPERGYKFSTYAYWWIRQTMYRAITKKGRLIKVPDQVAESMYHLTRVRAKLIDLLGREPTITEVAGELKMTVEEFTYAILMTSARPASLDQSQLTDGTHWIEIIGTGSNEEQLEAIDHELRMDKLLSLVERLPKDQYHAICSTYGLLGHKMKNLSELGRELGASRETIRHRLTRAERSLRLKLTAA